jgi:hypothetical protein
MRRSSLTSAIDARGVTRRMKPGVGGQVTGMRGLILGDARLHGALRCHGEKPAQVLDFCRALGEMMRT